MSSINKELAKDHGKLGRKFEGISSKISNDPWEEGEELFEDDDDEDSSFEDNEDLEDYSPGKYIV